MTPARRTLLVCSLAVFASFFGITGCLVMLRSIQATFHRPVPEMTWVPSTYTLAVAVSIILAGAVAERIGRRTAFVAGCLLVAIGSTVVAASGAFAVAVVGQAIAGIGAASVMANSLTLVTLRFPDTRARGQAIATWVAATGLGLAAGPVVCGYIVEHLSWRIPFAAVAVAMLAIGLAGLLVPETDRATRPIDLPGQLLVVLTVAGLVVGLLRAGVRGFADPQPIGCFAVAAVAATLLAVVELRTSRPILDVRMFGNGAYTASLLVGAAGLFGFVGSVLIQAQFAQRGLGLGPAATGPRLLLQVVPFAVISFVSAQIVARFGPRLSIGTGLAVAAAGAAGLAIWGPDLPIPMLGILLALIGAGSACAVAPSTSAALSSVELAQLGDATITVSAFRQLGAVLGTALLGTIMLLHSFDGLGSLLHGALPSNVADQVVTAVRSGVPHQASPQLTQLLDRSFPDAFGGGAQTAYTVLAVVLAALSALSLRLLPRELSPLLAPPKPVREQPVAPVGASAGGAS